MKKMGILLRGGMDDRANAYRRAGTARRIRVEAVLPERADPQLQSALLYRMCQLAYDAVAVYPENGENLLNRLTGVRCPMLTVGLALDAPQCREVMVTGATPDDEAREVLDALMGLTG